MAGWVMSAGGGSGCSGGGAAAGSSKRRHAGTAACGEARTWAVAPYHARMFMRMHDPSTGLQQPSPPHCPSGRAALTGCCPSGPLEAA